MTPARRAALVSIRQQLSVMTETLKAFAVRSEDDYLVECRLTDAAAYVGNAIDEIEKAEAVQ